MNKTIAAPGLSSMLAFAAGPAHASGSPIGDELGFFVAWMALAAVLFAASLVLAIRRARWRGARSGWLHLGGAVLTLPVGAMLSLALFSTRFGTSLSTIGSILAATLLPTLALWLAYLAAMHFDDQREANRAWKSTR